MIKRLPKFILNDEYFIRFVSKSDYKNKLRVENDKIDFSRFLLPYNGGVSLQRGFFCTENEAKILAKLIFPKDYVGFYVFKKSCFDDGIKSYLKSNPNFVADIFATPLNTINEYIPLPIESSNFEVEEGNPSHSDLIYINPASKDGETPKTSIRSFVRKFFDERKLIVDKYNEDLHFSGCNFNEI